MVQLKRRHLIKFGLIEGNMNGLMIGGLIRNDGTNLLYILLKTINPDTSIGFSNLKGEIEKEILFKFCNNVKQIDDISSNYTIVISKE